jgi:hypothetical protein
VDEWRWVKPIEVLSIYLTNGFVYSINRSEIGRERERESEQLGKSMMDGWMMDGRMAGNDDEGVVYMRYMPIEGQSRVIRTDKTMRRKVTYKRRCRIRRLMMMMMR